MSLSNLFLIQRQHLSRHEKYPHIVNVETTKSTSVADEVPDESKVSCGSSKLDYEGISRFFLTDDLYLCISADK